MISAITQHLDILVARFCNQHALASTLTPEVAGSSRMDNTQPQFNSGSTPQHNPNAKSNNDLGSRPSGLAAKSKQFGYKKQISVALPDFDRLQSKEEGYLHHSMYLILPEYQSE